MLYTTKTIPITNLKVNTENYRFEPVTNQRAAISTLLDDQKDNNRYKYTHHNKGEDVEYHGYLLRYCQNVKNNEKRNYRSIR